MRGKRSWLPQAGPKDRRCIVLSPLDACSTPWVTSHSTKSVGSQLPRDKLRCTGLTTRCLRGRRSYGRQCYLSRSSTSLSRTPVSLGETLFGPDRTFRLPHASFRVPWPRLSGHVEIGRACPRERAGCPGIQERRSHVASSSVRKSTRLDFSHHTVKRILPCA